jgi:hypothetical protein
MIQIDLISRDRSIMVTIHNKNNRINNSMGNMVDNKMMNINMETIWTRVTISKTWIRISSSLIKIKDVMTITNKLIVKIMGATTRINMDKIRLITIQSSNSNSIQTGNTQMSPISAMWIWTKIICPITISLMGMTNNGSNLVIILNKWTCQTNSTIR